MATAGPARAAVALIVAVAAACGTDPAGARTAGAAGPTANAVAAPAPEPPGPPVTAGPPWRSAERTPSPGARVLAKAAGWRPALTPLAGRYHGIVEVTHDAAGARRAWRENRPSVTGGTGGTGAGVHRTLAEVDLSRQALVVWSSGRSSSCPVWLVTLATTPSGSVNVSTGTAVRPGQACTDDYSAYRMLLAVDRDLLPRVGGLPTTDVLLDGAAFAAPVLVTSYPARDPGGAPLP